MAHWIDTFQSGQRDRKQDTTVCSLCSKFFPENEKSYDQKEHIRNEGKITGRKRRELGNEYRKTGDTAKREVVGELEKVDTHCHDQCTASE